MVNLNLLLLRISFDWVISAFIIILGSFLILLDIILFVTDITTRSFADLADIEVRLLLLLNTKLIAFQPDIHFEVLNIIILIENNLVLTMELKFAEQDWQEPLSWLSLLIKYPSSR